VIFPRQKKVRRIVAQKIRKRKGLKVLTNEMIKKYKGKRCKITTGALGTTVVGKMVEINENWIEIETRKGIEIINSDFIQSVRII